MNHTQGLILRMYRNGAFIYVNGNGNLENLLESNLARSVICDLQPFVRAILPGTLCSLEALP